MSAHLCPQVLSNTAHSQRACLGAGLTLQLFLFPEKEPEDYTKE